MKEDDPHPSKSPYLLVLSAGLAVLAKRRTFHCLPTPSDRWTHSRTEELLEKYHTGKRRAVCVPLQEQCGVPMPRAA